MKWLCEEFKAIMKKTLITKLKEKRGSGCVQVKFREGQVDCESGNVF